MGQQNSQLLNDMVSKSNCADPTFAFVSNLLVDREEIERLRRRFLKLDRDGSGWLFNSIPD